MASALKHVFGPDTALIRDRTYYVLDTGAELVAAGGWSKRRTLYGGDQMKTVEDPPLYRALGFTELERLTVSLPDHVELAVVRMGRSVASRSVSPTL